MERKNLLKSIIVIGLSLILVLSFASYVLADDTNTDFDWDDAEIVGGNNVTGNNVTGNTAGNTTNNVSGNNTNNTNNSGNLLNSVGTNTSNNSRNNTTNRVGNNVVSSNSLAYTGSENGGIIAIIAVAGAIVTIYSYMKIKEYKNI